MLYGNVWHQSGITPHIIHVLYSGNDLFFPRENGSYYIHNKFCALSQATEIEGMAVMQQIAECFQRNVVSV